LLKACNFNVGIDGKGESLLNGLIKWVWEGGGRNAYKILNKKYKRIV